MLLNGRYIWFERLVNLSLSITTDIMSIILNLLRQKLDLLIEIR